MTYGWASDGITIFKRIFQAYMTFIISEEILSLS
jgi:hypothetical protein